MWWLKRLHGSFSVLQHTGDYRHIGDYYLSNSKTFQDGNGNGNFEEINSNDFQDGNWESMENEGVTAGAKTVTVMVIHPNFKTVTVTVIFGKYILNNNPENPYPWIFKSPLFLQWFLAFTPKIWGWNPHPPNLGGNIFSRITRLLVMILTRTVNL